MNTLKKLMLAGVIAAKCLTGGAAGDALAVTPNPAPPPPAAPAAAVVLPPVRIIVPAVQQFQVEYRLGVEARSTPGGVEVTAVTLGSAATRMTRVGPGGVLIRGEMELGDVITHIGGTQVRTPAQIRTALQASGGCPVRVTVWDCKSGQTFDWTVQPTTVLIPLLPRFVPALLPAQASE